MDESAGWCVSKRSLEDLRGWDPTGSLRAGRYTRRECGICRNRKTCHRLHINERYSAGRKTREGCALIVAHFQAAGFSFVLVYVLRTRAHSYLDSMLREKTKSPANNRFASRSTGERLFSFNMQGVLWRAKAVDSFRCSRCDVAT